MKLYGKVQRRIYLMKDSGKGPMLIPDYRYIYSVYPDKPTEIPDDTAKMLLEQNPDILSKRPFFVMEENDKEPEKISKLQVLEIPEPIQNITEQNESKQKKEPVPEPELPKGKPIGKSPIPD